MQDNFPKDTKHFQLLICDYDGTLAGDEHVVTKKVADAVKKWEKAGKHFTIATGRQYLMIKDECKKMGQTTPVIVRGGAEVVDPVTDEIMFAEYITNADVKKILEILQPKDVAGYSIEKDDIIYSNFDILLPFPLIKFKKHAEFELSNVAKFHIKPRNGREKETEELIVKIEKNIPNVNAFATHNPKFGKGWDITSVKATKLFGVVKVMEHLNINREDIVGVGDSYNDFPLLEAAGLKVAMGNAHKELIEIADLVIPSNDEDGVAYLIDKLLENSKY